MPQKNDTNNFSQLYARESSLQRCGIFCCMLFKVLVSHHSVCKHHNVHPPRPPWPPPCCGHRDLNKNNNINSLELLFGRCSHRFCCSAISKSPGKVFLHRSSMSLCSWRFETTLANTFPTKCAVGARGSRATHRQSRNGESKSRKTGVSREGSMAWSKPCASAAAVAETLVKYGGKTSPA